MPRDLYLEHSGGHLFGLTLIVSLDGVICVIDQRNLRRIESGCVARAESALLDSKKLWCKGCLIREKRGQKTRRQDKGC